MPVLKVEDIHVSFGAVSILRGVSFSLEQGKTLGVVGESGCGKSMTARALMGMTPPGGKLTGSIKLDARELIGQPERDWQDIRGKEIALVMQDPFTSLNPIMKVGHQVAEVFQLHQSMSASQAWDAAVDMLDKVGIPDPSQSAKKYPHQMSGGQRQRVVIATAFACQPKVLIADEPTTALDVTLQAQILRLVNDLQREFKTAVIFISHDIGVIAEEADEIAVFYAGQIVEQGETQQVLRNPMHPYTKALLGALPQPGKLRLDSITGQPPRFDDLPVGCSFSPRCQFKQPQCEQAPSLEWNDSRAVRCWRANELADSAKG